MESPYICNIFLVTNDSAPSYTRRPRDPPRGPMGTRERDTAYELEGELLEVLAWRPLDPGVAAAPGASVIKRQYSSERAQ